MGFAFPSDMYSPLERLALFFCVYINSIVRECDCEKTFYWHSAVNWISFAREKLVRNRLECKR